MAETNGMAEITVAGVKYPLLFARLAVQEMTTRSLTNPSGNPVLLLINLIHSGLLNHAVFTDSVHPLYPETYLLVDMFAEEEDAKEQEQKLWNIFESSRWGADWVAKLEEAKKKMDKQTENLKAKN